MLAKDKFCFAKAWAPYFTQANKEYTNITLLQVNICFIVKYDNLDESTIFKIIDSYPFILDEDDVVFKVSDTIREKYALQKVRIAAFHKSEFAQSLPDELVEIISSNC